MLKRKERELKEDNIKNVLIELRDNDIKDISKLISKQLEKNELTEKYKNNYEKLEKIHRTYKEKDRMIKDFGVKIGKVNQKEYKEILNYKGNKKRDFRLKSFKRKGNKRVIYLYI